VTGGLGFIGSRVGGALLDDGAALRIVDDLSGAYAPATGPAAARELAARGAEVMIGPAEPAHLRGVKAVIHLAALPGVRTRRPPSALHRTNVLLTGRLVRAASERGIRFVFVSSSSVYGDARDLPTPEHARAAPLNPYAASKVAAEAAVRRRGADAVIVRPFTVYGPGQRPEMAFARWIALLDGRQPLPWYAPPGTARDFTVRRRRRRRDPRRTSPRPGRRGLQPVGLALGRAAGRFEGAGGSGRPPGLAPDESGLGRRGSHHSRRPAHGGRGARLRASGGLATGIGCQLAAASPGRLAA